MSVPGFDCGEGFFSGRVERTLNAHWAYDGSTFLQTAPKAGNGVSGDREIAKREAFVKSSQSLFTAFEQQVEQSARTNP